MTVFDWGREWNLEFCKQIGDQAVKSDVPASRWLAAGRGRTKTNPAGEDRNWWNKYGPSFAKKWADFLEGQKDWEPYYTPEGNPGIELFTEFVVGGTPVKAIPDRVYRKKSTGGLVVVDLKSGGRIPDGGYQLPIYQLAMDVAFNETVEESFYFMNRKGELIPSNSPVEYSRDLMEWVFMQAIKQAETGPYLPNPGSQCKRCSVAAACKVVGGSKER